MKVTTSIITNNIKPEIVSSQIPNQLIDIQVEYALKIRLAKMFPEIPPKLISDAVDRIRVDRFVDHLKNQPNNKSINNLIASAIQFELLKSYGSVDFGKVLICTMSE